MSKTTPGVVESNALPSRRTEKIETKICRECFVAVPGDRLDAHAEWHEKLKKMRS